MTGVKIKDIVKLINAAATYEAAGFRSHVMAPRQGAAVSVSDLGPRFKDFILSKPDTEVAALALAIDKLIVGAHGLADAEVGLGFTRDGTPETEG